MPDKNNPYHVGALQYGKSKKILSAMIIDDEIDFVKIFEELLYTLGINVVATAHSGKDAAELYQILEPDVVFLDLLMPEYDGFYALEMIKQASPSSKIIIVTANPETEYMMELKADAFIKKPFGMGEIKKVVNWIEQTR
jgi:CheY-like chemotaxis protein